MPFDGPAKLIPEADLARGCPKCDGRKITEQAWDSSDGGHTDYKFECQGCGHSWWHEGIDA